MATLIDALVVTLGLDPDEFLKGQKAATEGSKTFSAELNKLKGEVLGIFAVLTAGKGLKDFIRDVVTTNTQVGFLAQTLGETTQELSNWRGTTQLLGGDADALTASMSALTQDLQGFVLTGQSSMIPYLRTLGVSIDAGNGKVKTASQLYLELADKFKALGPKEATFFGRALGMDQGTINLLVQGRAAVEALRHEQERLGTTTEEDRQAAAALYKSWQDLTQSSASLGRTLLTDVAPALEWIAEKLTDLAVFMRGHQNFMKGFFTIIAVGVGILAVALLSLLGPIGAIGLAFVISAGFIALWYDDLKTWLDGGKSLLGGFYQAVADTFKGIASVVSEAFKGLGYLASQAISEALNGARDKVNAFWREHFGHDLFKGKIPTPASPFEKKAPAVSQPGQQPAPAKKQTAADTAIDRVLRHEDSTLSGKVTNDSGGITKYGISSKANPGVDVANLTIEQARAIYKRKYWDAIGGDKIPAALQGEALDAAVNQGVGNALKWLKASGGDLSKFETLRRQQYQGLADANPAKYGQFLKGWLGRVGASGAGGGGSNVRTTIDQITINTRATDAKGIAGAIGTALDNQLSTQANTGAS